MSLDIFITERFTGIQLETPFLAMSAPKTCLRELKGAGLIDEGEGEEYKFRINSKIADHVRKVLGDNLSGNLKDLLETYYDYEYEVLIY